MTSLLFPVLCSFQLQFCPQHCSKQSVSLSWPPSFSILHIYYSKNALLSPHLKDLILLNKVVTCIKKLGLPGMNNLHFPFYHSSTPTCTCLLLSLQEKCAPFALTNSSVCASNWFPCVSCHSLSPLPCFCHSVSFPSKRLRLWMWLWEPADQHRQGRHRRD